MKSMYLSGYFLLVGLFISTNSLGMYTPGLFKGKKESNDNEEKIEVTMWKEEEIHLEPNETKTKSLYTNGLQGCTALALIVKCMNKSLHAHMSHYPPTDMIKQRLELGKADYQFEKLCGNKIEFKKLIVVSPEFGNNENSGFEKEVNDKYNDHIEILSKISGVQPDVTPYLFNFETKHQEHDFEVSLSNYKKSFYQSKSDGHKYNFLFEKDIQENNN